MAKPRIFISSTFYDLRHVRTDLDTFIESLGYDPVRNEEGKIPYGKDDPLEEYCYKEIQNIDILISIIGGRFGSESKGNETSVSQQEFKTALKQGKQVYIFIEKNVASEFETYLLNKEKDLTYKFVDDVRIYKFIEDVKALPTNNNTKEFESSYDIMKYLKEQFAGLFQRFLQEQTRIKEINLIKNLENTTKNLDQLVTYLSQENKDKTAEINSILMINHPLVGNLTQSLSINYKVYIEHFKDLNELLKARGFVQAENTINDAFETYFQWTRSTNKMNQKVLISFELFEDDQRLKFMRQSEWKEDYFSYEEEQKDDDDLPF